MQITAVLLSSLLLHSVASQSLGSFYQRDLNVADIRRRGMGSLSRRGAGNSRGSGRVGRVGRWLGLSSKTGSEQGDSQTGHQGKRPSGHNGISSSALFNPAPGSTVLHRPSLGHQKPNQGQPGANQGQPGNTGISSSALFNPAPGSTVLHRPSLGEPGKQSSGEKRISSKALFDLAPGSTVPAQVHQGRLETEQGPIRVPQDYR